MINVLSTDSNVNEWIYKTGINTIIDLLFEINANMVQMSNYFCIIFIFNIYATGKYFYVFTKGCRFMIHKHIG